MRRWIKDKFTALESGWRAGLKQFRKRDTELYNARHPKAAPATQGEPS